MKIELTVKELLELIQDNKVPPVRKGDVTTADEMRSLLEQANNKRNKEYFL